MGKQIKINYNDIEYTLEFNRRSIQKLEQLGFNLGLLESKPLTNIPRLFYGAFLFHHPKITEEFATEIFELIPNKDDFLIKLVEMYSEPLTALMGDTEKGNVNWEVNW